MDFSSIKNSVSNAIKGSLHNYKAGDKEIEVNKIIFDDKNLNKITSWSSLQKLKNRNRSLTVPVYADLTLKNNGKAVSKAKKIKLGQVPVLTNNGTFLVDGIEYSVPLQLRRDPGIYTSMSDNGMFVTNINSAKGRNYKIELDPNTNVQKINIDGTKIPLLPVLTGLGLTKNKIIKSWGNNANAKTMYAINEKAADTSHGRKAMEKFYKKLEYAPNPNATQDDIKNSVLKYLDEKSEFNPHVNRITLGKPYGKLSPGALLDVSKKLVNIANQKEDFDDTENLMFKHVKLANDLVAERINQDFKKKLTASINRNMKNFNTVKEIIKPGMFTKSIKSFFNESQISEPSEQVNPLHILSTNDKVTLKGEGGITDMHTVSSSMKSLHPSYFGFIDPLHTPDTAAGLVNHLAIGSSVDHGGKLQSFFIDAKTGKIKQNNVLDIYNKNIAKSDQYKITPNKKPIPLHSKIKVFFRGKSKVIPASKVDIIVPHGSFVYDMSTNLVPFINSSSGNRISMAGKHAEQTISLINRETPLVSTVTKSGNEFTKVIGSLASIKTPIDGIVKKITPDNIIIQDKKKKLHSVELRNNMELNQESFYHDTAVVKVGEKVKKGQLLAKNNWLDDKGRLALGVNARIGYFPYKGFNIEDGSVISSDFAKRLTSQHLHVQDIHFKKGELNLDKFKIFFKHKYKPENFFKLDSDGVIKKGSVVNSGDILVAYGQPIELGEEAKILGKTLTKGFKNKLLDKSIVWHYDFPATVIEVIKSSNFVKVKVKSQQEAQITDKLAGRYGNKGIISSIVPVSEMPHTADGKPLDMIMNPHGIAGRINVSQMYEAALGKIAKKTGKRYLLENFKEKDNWKFVEGELKKHKMSVNEPLFDPNTKKELKAWNPVTKRYELPFIGNAYIHKSVHQTRKKFDARSIGTYSSVDMPSKDPEASHYIGSSASKANPKSVDRLTLYSLLAHGAKDVVKDMFNNKGQRRDDVWDAIIHGRMIPSPVESTTTKKFNAMLKAAGINVESKGRFRQYLPITDADTLKLSSGRIPKPNLFLRGKDLTPLKNGMFDPNLTGGSQNMTRYNHIDLGVKIPNPITKNAIKVMLDLSESDFNGILKGDKKVAGLSGMRFFEQRLKNLNTTSEIAKLEKQKGKAPKSKINMINRKLRYLKALEHNGLKPEDYLISKLPVIPTKFRPILPLPNGTIEPAPINNLYRDTALAVKLSNEKIFPNFLKDEARAELYNVVSGLAGVTEPTINTQNSLIKKRDLKSVLTEIGGSGSPKGGFLHSKVLSKTQDFIGNSVIAIGPDLGIDEIGLPYKMAEIIYEPWILRKLHQLGHKVSKIEYNNLKEKNPLLIRTIVQDIVKERPVLVNRNPSLHKGSIMAFNPMLIAGKSLKINPLILNPFNADFDGDQMPVHVPVSKEAVAQAYKMVPSLNFYNPKNDSAHINFDQEYVAGIALMTEEGQKTKQKFRTFKDAEKAYETNKIRVTDQIKIGRKSTSFGREQLEKTIPKEFKIKVDRVFTKTDIQNILSKMVKDGSVSKYTDVINKLKDFGSKYSYDEAFSFSLNDIKPKPEIRAKILAPSHALIRKALTDDKKKDIIMKYSDLAGNSLKAGFAKEHNRFFLPSIYGSKKISPDVMRQITVTPFYASGVGDKLIDTPIDKSYSEGLDIHDNFLMAYGARKGLVDKVSSVEEPGVLSKELIGSFSGVNISGTDCGTTNGVPVSTSDSFNLQGRVLAKKCNGVKAGTILTSKYLMDIKKGKEKTAIVRSPLTCKMHKGVCSRCYGLGEHGVLPSIGDPIGIKAAQSIGETGTQSALSSFHRGGTASGGSFRSGFEHTKFLLHMPDNVKNKATLAQKDGKIVSITKGVSGQHVIKIDTDPSPYIARNTLKVKVGDVVSKGDSLDEGVVKITEYADLVPIGKVRSHLTDELEKSYSGTKILRRNTETIVKGVTGYSSVLNPGTSPYLENEVISTNFSDWIKSGKPIPVEDAIGWKLSKGVGGYGANEVITIDIANDLLEKKGIPTVYVNATGLETRPKMMGINTIPLVQPDIMKKMSFQRIKSALKEGPISGEYSNIHGAFPEPALAIATEFGDPKFSYY
jgi:DNA-directed RNA polymerase beta subunit/DNA-directed RNA polymerase beta' subunit